MWAIGEMIQFREAPAIRAPTISNEVGSLMFRSSLEIECVGADAAFDQITAKVRRIE